MKAGTDINFLGTLENNLVFDVLSFIWFTIVIYFFG